MNRILRLLHAHLRGQFSPGSPGCAHRRATTASTLIRVFYAMMFYTAIQDLSRWPRWLGETVFDPLWPVFWSQWTGPEAAIRIILALNLAGVLAALFFGRWRTVRILAFIGILEFVAYRNSFGKINHNEHFYILISFLLIFLPRGWEHPARNDRLGQAALLRIFATCQTLILLTYSLSGLGKVAAGLYQWAIGQEHIFGPRALALRTAFRLVQTGSDSILGPLLLERPVVGWPFMLSAVYLQLFALYAAFRPHLHRPWAAALILFHIGSSLLMNINFHTHCLMLALFLVFSPFVPPVSTPYDVLRSLPLFGRWIPRRLRP